jgi:hypothetical protein
LVGYPEGKIPLGTALQWLKIILTWFLRIEDGVIWTGLICLRIGTGDELL